MRLIDADRLKAAIHTDFSEHFTLYHDTDQTALFDMVMDDIDEMPTAFDKERVIEELKKHADIAFETDDAYGSEVAYGEWTAYKQAEEIVEKGGLN